MRRRLVSFILCLVLVLQVPLVAYADTGSGGAGFTPIFKSGSGGGSSATLAGVMQSYGYRVTMTTASPIIESGINQLTGNYTADELDQQYKDIVNIGRVRYWEPGSHGLNFTSDYSGIRDLQRGVVGSLMFAPNPTGKCYPFGDGGATYETNRLAWAIYDTEDNYTIRPMKEDGVTPKDGYDFKKELYELIIDQGPELAQSDPGSWVDQVRAMYMSAPGSNDVGALMNKVFSNTDTAFKDLSEFTWSTRAATSQVGTPQQRVKWSWLGMISTCFYLCWLAQDRGDANTYVEYVTALANWAASGWDPEAAVVIELEATSCTGESGTGVYDQTWLMPTMPTLLSYVYGDDVVAQLFAGWGDPNKSVKDFLAEITNGKPDPGVNNAVMYQAFDGYWTGGHFKDGFVKGSYNGPRHFCKLLWPVTVENGGNPTQSYGWGVNFCYYAEKPFGPPTSKGAKGSFTWDLKPKGVIDKTPAKQISESSTIYNLNISQAGFNNNNYAEWETWVRSDAEDCNKIRINIYHVSDTLPKETKSPVYTRGQVKAKGKKVTEAVERVTPGTGVIGGYPAGFTKTIKNGEEVELSDDELLLLLKTATGLTYNETVA